MNAEHLKERFHGAIHRSPKAMSNMELEEVAAVTLAAVGELATEMALVVAELASRVEALETKAGTP